MDILCNETSTSTNPSRMMRFVPTVTFLLLFLHALVTLSSLYLSEKTIVLKYAKYILNLVLF